MNAAAPSPLSRLLRKLNHHRTTEAYFIGYPKTGNTWVRFMLGRYMQLSCGLPCQPLFDATDWLGRCERGCVGPAIQFTHRPLVWKGQTAENLTPSQVIAPFIGKEVVLLARHPLDALVSLWMQRLHRRSSGYQGSLPEMLDDPVWGLGKYLRFHDLWERHRGQVRSFHLLRYEDMRTDPVDRFHALLDYLNIPVYEDHLRLAVADSNFESMKRIESSNQGPTYRSSGLGIFATGDKGNPDAFHVRRGKVGGYSDYLNPAEIERYQSRIDEYLPPFYGYSRN